MTGKGRSGKEVEGLGVIGLILWTGLLVFLLLILQLQVANLASSTGGLDSQLNSFVLAENGLEFARSVMQALEPEQLIAGRDGVIDGSYRSGWRNPLSFAAARQLDREDSLVSSPDDGFPWDPGTGRLRARLRMGSGEAVIRFSNNPEEAPDQDRDGELMVRSMGIAPSLAPLWSSFGQRLAHQVTLLEARFRHSRYFRAPVPLLLWNADVDFEGEPSLVGKTASLIGCVRTDLDSASQQIQQLRAELAPYLETPGSAIQDLTAEFRADPHRGRMFQEGFWESLLSQLPLFIDERIESRIFYLADGGVLSGSWEGLIVSSGELLLEPDFKLSGLLLHLGPGELRLSAGSRIQGAVWKISGHPGSPARIILEETAGIEYQEGQVAAAMKALPADLTGFRIIFPEMRQ